MMESRNIRQLLLCRVKDEKRFASIRLLCGLNLFKPRTIHEQAKKQNLFLRPPLIERGEMADNFCSVDTADYTKFASKGEVSE
jgi:hypothetical protein